MASQWLIGLARQPAIQNYPGQAGKIILILEAGYCFSQPAVDNCTIAVRFSSFGPIIYVMLTYNEVLIAREMICFLDDSYYQEYSRIKLHKNRVTTFNC